MLMSIRCNICSLDLDEKDIEAHLKDIQHQSNKKSILDSKGKENKNGKSLIEIWLESLESGKIE